MKFLNVVTLLMFTPAFAFAGNGGVHGGDKLSRILSYAHDVEVPKIVASVNPSNPVFDGVMVREKGDDGSYHVVTLRDKYSRTQKTFTKDLSGLPLSIANDIKDTDLGYHTWIGIDLDRHEIVYDPTKYQEIEMVAPTSASMDEALLHEMGHFYKLDEDGCVTFARVIMAANKQNGSKPARPGTSDPSGIWESPLNSKLTFSLSFLGQNQWLIQMPSRYGNGKTVDTNLTYDPSDATLHGQCTGTQKHFSVQDFHGANECVYSDLATHLDEIKSVKILPGQLIIEPCLPLSIQASYEKEGVYFFDCPDKLNPQLIPTTRRTAKSEAAAERSRESEPNTVTPVQPQPVVTPVQKQPPKIVGYKCVVGEIDAYNQMAKLFRYPVYDNSPDVGSAYDARGQMITDNTNYFYSDCAYNSDGLTYSYKRFSRCETLRSKTTLCTF